MNYFQGIIYTAIGSKYVEEAQISAISVKKFLPDIQITVFTDSPPSNKGAFDQIIKLESLHPKPHINKLISMMKSPYQKTLFLDTDTFICGDISELFDLLDHFDIAMAHDRGYYDDFPEVIGVPDAFREFNQGVIVFKQSEKLHQVLVESLKWSEILFNQSGEYPYDQPPLRIALYLSDIRIAPLTHEFNCRYHSFGYLNGEVKILHGRIPGKEYNEANLNTIVVKINQETIPRVFVAGEVFVLARTKMFNINNNFPKHTATLFQSRLVPYKLIIKRFVAIVKNEGIMGFFRRLLKKLTDT
ncbi:glycosyltransferase [Geminocystis sp. NIES-3709]|uniref:glycosyltransferase n=1 Tax=Geminocystis sp. NIES-3709 TaxID=1617448 RepID=UPI0005FC5A29|nr:glycosyltransferase [Geminocystis sp. NIES-3709]BAQ65147.1 hypothetical protein GM3709_1912 [Geminocystis sp. NIES-3709]